MIEQIMSDIRQRVRQRTTSGITMPLTLLDELSRPHEIAMQGSGRLAELDEAIAGAANAIGACPPVPKTVRGRFGSLIVRLISRALWWQQGQMRDCLSAIALRNAEQAKYFLEFEQEFTKSATAAVHRALGEVARQMSELQAGIIECRTQIRAMQGDIEDRLRELEFAQIHLQSARLEEIADEDVTFLQQETRHIERRFQNELNSVLERLAALEVKTKVGGVVGRSASSLEAPPEIDNSIVIALQTEIQELVSRQSTEAKAREALLAERLEGGIEALKGQARELAERLEGEAKAREGLAGSTGEQWTRLEGGIEALKGRAQELVERLEGEAKVRLDLGTSVNTLNTRLVNVDERLVSLGGETDKHGCTLRLLDRRFTTVLREVRRTLPPDDSSGSTLRHHTDHYLDALYVDFAAAFRGSPDEIAARQSVYLPLFKKAGLGSSQTPIIDLGCGRGEWLELLKKQEMEARGIDSNLVLLEHCRALGLNVIEAEAVDYLRSLADATVGAVTSFHMVEHLPFESIIEMLDEAMRAIKPGGLLLLETPNPGNIQVASHYFYLDPTHLRPLPSPMLRYFVELRGFCDIEVWNLHPYPTATRVSEESQVATRFNEYFYGPRDYAIIARRP